MKVFCYNKKAKHNYHLETSYEAGLVLKGTEVKGIIKNQVNLDQAYVLIRKGEMFLFNCHINPYEQGNIFNVEPMRRRKLLLHKREIIRLTLLLQQQKMQLVPTKIYYKHNKLKLEFFTAKSKKLHDKREDLKTRDLKRRIKNNIF